MELGDAVRQTGAQLIVMVYPEVHDLFCDYLRDSVIGKSERVPVIVVGRRGTKKLTDLNIPGIDAYLCREELRRLPSLAAKLVHSQSTRISPDTRQLSMEALRESQKLISIGRLAAEISHEINNPLESVGNLLYLAQCEPQLTDKATEYLRSAERELARVVQISKQTLTFSRESMKPTRVHIGELMDEVVALYSRRIAEKKLDLKRDFSSDEGITALPGEIRQVLSNLVTNAIEASAEGGRLYLRIHSARQWRNDSPVKGLRISVADSGSGIPAEVRKHLGQLFFTTKGQSGTGLGLFVTKTIIRRYGGTLQVRSRAGESMAEGSHGTVFSIFLPFASAAPAETKPVDSPSRRANVMQISNHPSHANNNHGSVDSRKTVSKFQAQQRNG
jgi:signal transduction histidine kinase